MGNEHLQSGSIFQPAMLDDPGVYELRVLGLGCLVVFLISILNPLINKVDAAGHSFNSSSCLKTMFPLRVFSFN